MAIFITALMLVVAGVASLSAQQEGAKLKVGDAAPNGVTTPEASHSVTIFAGVAGAAQHEQATVEMFHGSFLSPRRVRAAHPTNIRKLAAQCSARQELRSRCLGGPRVCGRPRRLAGETLRS